MKKEEGHIIKVDGEVLCNGTGSHSLSHVGNDALMPLCAPVMAGKEVWGVMMVGVMVRPQGGRGYRPPEAGTAEKCTDRQPHFIDPRGISYPFSIIDYKIYKI